MFLSQVRNPVFNDQPHVIKQSVVTMSSLAMTIVFATYEYLSSGILLPFNGQDTQVIIFISTLPSGHTPADDPVGECGCSFNLTVNSLNLRFKCPNSTQ